MELTIFIELILKALIPILVKEFFTLANTSIDDYRQDRNQVESKSEISIEALIDLNQSLKKENTFQQEQIKNLRDMIEKFQSRLPSTLDEN